METFDNRFARDGQQTEAKIAGSLQEFGEPWHFTYLDEGVEISPLRTHNASTKLPGVVTVDFVDDKGRAEIIAARPFLARDEPDRRSDA